LKSPSRRLTNNDSRLTIASARWLALMRFKLRYGYLKHSSAFRTSNTGRIPHHIHHANAEGCPMCLDAGREIFKRGMLVRAHRLILTRQMSRQRLKREPMRQMAGATGQNKMVG
jgi:hypothetical protein